MDPKRIVVRITPEIVEQAVFRRKYQDSHYYAHDDHDGHRIIWITIGPIEKLVNRHVAFELSTCYGSRKLALVEYHGKTHLKAKMLERVDATERFASARVILGEAPRDGAVGRKPTIAHRTIIKVHVPAEMVDLFRRLGDGNLSLGVRIAGELAAERNK